jgi:hypothetical protein
MSIHDQDTDPSSPSALRGLVATDPTPNPATHVSTDPGLGPGSAVPGAAPAVGGVPQPGAGPGASPLPPQATQRRVPTPPQPLGIIVPATSTVTPKKDSVELLLDGMQGPQLERPKTTPQTDGESHAAYHAQHLVHPSQAGPSDEPKVVVERPVLAATTRIDRAKVAAVIAEHDAQRRSNDSTVVLPQQVAPRIVVAVVAGLIVVIGIFFVVKVIVARSAADANARRGATAPLPTVTAATPAATPTIPAAATTPSLPEATAPTPSAAAALPPASAATSPAAAAPRGTTAPFPWPTAPAASRPRAGKPSSDVGEFKTTF